MKNGGVAWGLWPGVPSWVVGVALLCLVVCAVKTRELWGRAGLFLMIIGGGANLVMRVKYGVVVDDLNLAGLLYNNVWDYLIVIGLITYGYSSFVRGRGDRRH